MFGSLKTQIALFYTVASVVTVILIGFILYLSISNVILDETLSSTRSAVEKSGTYIESYVDRMKGIAHMISRHPSTIGYLSGEGDTEQNIESILNLIGSAIESDDAITSIIIVGKSGQLISNEETLDMSMSEDMMRETWYVDAINSGDMPVLTSARMQKFSMDKDNWVISLSKEIVDDNGSNIGVMVIDIRYSVIEGYLTDLDLGHEGYAFILNRTNEVVYHHDTSYFVDEAKIRDLVHMGQMPPGYDKSMNKLFHQYEFANTDWILSGVVSLDSLYIIRTQLIQTIVLIGILGLVVLLVIGTYIAGRITDPIKKLERAMQDVEEGLYEIEETAGSCNEVRSLAAHYNVMISEIKGLMADIAKQEKAIRAYELNVLHSQINPHFLYNTLDTIVWMAEFGDSDKVVEVTKSLARFFRLSLSGGSEVTTIAHEVEHVTQYLFIQKQRYKDKLSYSIEVDEQLSETIIPKIILQPIVENAIYHGIRNIDETGLITIQIYPDNTDIVFEVEDNGEGFDVHQMSSAKKEKTVKLGGVGINNVDKRLKLAYGESYGITMTSVPGKGTKVAMRLGNEIKKAYNVFK